MMTREEALKAVEANIKTQNLVKHMLATEAIMRALARRLGQDEEEWGLAGLLHDIDLEVCHEDLSCHSKIGAEMVARMGVNPAISHAILCHNAAHGVPCDSLMDKALYCTDPLTGLITAAALIRPEKKLALVEEKSVRKRFKEKSFAAGASREQIATCSNIGLELDDFIGLGLAAMQGISGELGL
jgi:putative nucleotidyltransferase with HDIG domain